jgi:hypothetical protein
MGGLNEAMLSGWPQKASDDLSFQANGRVIRSSSKMPTSPDYGCKKSRAEKIQRGFCF